MTGEYRIRDEHPGDAAGINAITAAAFAPMPYSAGTEPRIIEALRDAGALAISLVAESAGQVVGHVAFSAVMIDGQDYSWFGLGPVSVAPERQREGIGSALIREGLSRLQSMGTGGCVLLGNPHYYGRFGFRHDPELFYPHGPKEAFQCLVLQGPARQGEVVYHQGFDVS